MSLGLILVAVCNLFQTNHAKCFSPSQNDVRAANLMETIIKQRTWSDRWSNWGKFLLPRRLKEQWEFSLRNWRHPQYNTTINRIRNRIESNALDATINLNARALLQIRNFELVGGFLRRFPKHHKRDKILSIQQRIHNSRWNAGRMEWHNNPPPSNNSKREQSKQIEFEMCLEFGQSQKREEKRNHADDSNDLTTNHNAIMPYCRNSA